MEKMFCRAHMGALKKLGQAGKLKPMATTCSLSKRCCKALRLAHSGESLLALALLVPCWTTPLPLSSKPGVSIPTGSSGMGSQSTRGAKRPLGPKNIWRSRLLAPEGWLKGPSVVPRVVANWERPGRRSFCLSLRRNPPAAESK